MAKNSNHIAQDTGEKLTPEEAYRRFALAKLGAPRVPEENFSFPYFEKREANQSLTAMDRIYWYLLNRIPVVLNGQTGIGKTTGVVNLAHQLNMHLSHITVSRKDTKAEYLTSQSQDPQTGYFITPPGPLIAAALHKGIFFMDEAANLMPKTATELNVIMQGYPETIDTHFGHVPIDWRDVLFVMSGNFHQARPSLDAAFLYRSVWVDFTRPDPEVSLSILKNRRLKRQGKPLDVPSGYESKRLEPFEVTDQLHDVLEHFANDLYQMLCNFSDLHKGIADTWPQKPGKMAAASALVADFRNRGLRPVLQDILRSYKDESPPDPNRAETYVIRPTWRDAFEMPFSVAERVVRLYHPEMTKTDLRHVLEDILINPGISILEIPFNRSVRNYVEGQRAIIRHCLDMYYDKLITTQP